MKEGGVVNRQTGKSPLEQNNLIHWTINYGYDNAVHRKMYDSFNEW